MRPPVVPWRRYCVFDGGNVRRFWCVSSCMRTNIGVAENGDMETISALGNAPGYGDPFAEDRLGWDTKNDRLADGHSCDDMGGRNVSDSDGYWSGCSWDG